MSSGLPQYAVNTEEAIHTKGAFFPLALGKHIAVFHENQNVFLLRCYI